MPIACPKKLMLVELSYMLAYRERIAQPKALTLLEGVIGDIEKSVSNGRAVNLKGVGTLQPVVTPARNIRLPRTGKMGVIPKKVRLRFRVAGVLREKLDKLNVNKVGK